MTRTTVIGISLGLVGLVIGCLLVLEQATPVHAMTAHGNERKSLATVPLDSGLEAVVTLNHHTGDLAGYVLDRVSGRFIVQYKYNISEDFPGTRGQYLIGSGMADFRGFRNNERVASGVIYVAEETTNQLAAYALPWNPQMATSGVQPQQRQFILLDKATTRFTNVR